MDEILDGLVVAGVVGVVDVDIVLVGDVGRVAVVCGQTREGLVLVVAGVREQRVEVFVVLERVRLHKPRDVRERVVLFDDVVQIRFAFPSDVENLANGGNGCVWMVWIVWWGRKWVAFVVDSNMPVEIADVLYPIQRLIVSRHDEFSVHCIMGSVLDIYKVGVDIVDNNDNKMV